MIQKNDISRLTGLDTLRAAAIVLVLMSHYMGFVSQKPTFGVIGNIGWAGVDLFFVLSGYLIGNQILAPIANKEPFSLKNFFARRLLRTLPNYYVVLAIYFLFPSVIAGSHTASIWKFLTFSQNFGLAYGETFTHSWSLCIEEQFYMLLPVIALVLARFRGSVRAAWCLILGAVAFGIAMRGAAFLQYGHHSRSAEVYYSSFCRFDELLPGVAVAMLKNFHQGLYKEILRHANLLLVAGFAAVVAVLSCIDAEFPNTFLATAFGFSLLAISFGLLVLAALSPTSLLSRIRVPGAGSLALWSYAVYLIHKPIFMVARVQLEKMHLDTDSPLIVLLVFVAGVLGGWILFRLVETPFMQMRTRWFPTKSRSSSASLTDHSAVKGVVTSAAANDDAVGYDGGTYRGS
jgi:peptidoglycan/LPS O-acetylase OafA/YrhL